MIKKTSTIDDSSNIVIIGRKDSDFEKFGLSGNEIHYINKQTDNKINEILINRYKRIIIISIINPEDKKPYEIAELARKSACSAHGIINRNKISTITIIHTENSKDELMSFTEGLELVNYQFLKYLKEADKKKNSLETIEIFGDIKKDEISSLNNIITGVYQARNMVNEPLSYLTAIQLSEEIKKLGQEAGFTVEVFNKNRIEALKFGGLLAVNKGSIDPPTFSVLEWKPNSAKNKKPIVLVGKGIVYDTGGLSLKPTPGSMDEMKSDMAGAAAVVGAMYAISKNKLPVHVVGLIPATDNRPDGNAYAPGDIIKMHNGLTVEVLNTDAEGRLILADALSYAKKYKPELVVDIATLTGAAAYSIGKYGIVGMESKVDESIFEKLEESGYNVYERIARFPFWEEYGELLKSDIADLKNIGGKEAGAITAGKFLENFTDYPYIHLDIAGPAFLNSNDNYRLKGGTGVGVRLIYNFIKNY